MAQQESNPTTLERTLGLRDLILLIIGTVIGSGIFIVPGGVLRQTGGSIRLAMLVWLTGGILSLLGALTYGELSAMNPKVGGLYIFIRDGFGSLPAFLYGWTLFFVISSGSVATLADGRQAGGNYHDRNRDCSERYRHERKREPPGLDYRHQSDRDSGNEPVTVCARPWIHHCLVSLARECRRE